MPKLSAVDTQIKEEFAKIKDREIKLEADLAAADFSDLEVAICELALTVVDYQKISQLVRSLPRPKYERESRFVRMQKQLVYHLHKLSIIEECILDMVKSDDKIESVYFKHIQKQSKAADALLECVQKHKGKFDIAGFDPAEAFNTIKNNLKRELHPPTHDKI